ncbi:MAG: DUF1992 domain-containing protein [Hamadaea sp.]|uniref:DnaJ family domain-containing protein n=1 Tax=Hamadaea sp. NPDC050747 TaxID=3155789 RepID=UPI0017F2A1E9|nr:DUF1992 domain-containing protein [Hamadaea sp.]NUR48946.1 DUF1992 domain-containing protein [Hamadaea sp.]NUT02441.1 DUF1992 domain-containing protein [Hamadaea sp.]
MGTWYESRIDRQIREAQERGDFDDLPGTGKPLPGAGEHYDEDWWLKSMVARENLGGLAPTSLKIRKAAEDILDEAVKKNSEQTVRQMVADLNDRIAQANRGLVDGPPVVIDRIDVDEVVREWRRLKGLA